MSPRGSATRRRRAGSARNRLDGGAILLPGATATAHPKPPWTVLRDAEKRVVARVVRRGPGTGV